MIHPRNRHFQKHSQDRIGLHQLRLIRNRFPHTEVQLQLHTRERNRIASHQEIVQQDLNKKYIFTGFDDFVRNAYRLQFR